jgi:hypothetical protein
MNANKSLIEFILPDSGEVVYAKDLREARQKLARFNYKREDLQSIVTYEEYESGTYLTHHGAKFDDERV